MTSSLESYILNCLVSGPNIQGVLKLKERTNKQINRKLRYKARKTVIVFLVDWNKIRGTVVQGRGKVLLIRGFILSLLLWLALVRCTAVNQG